MKLFLNAIASMGESLLDSSLSLVGPVASVYLRPRSDDLRCRISRWASVDCCSICGCKIIISISGLLRKVG